MSDFDTIQEILKNNNIGFSINNSDYDNRDGRYNIINLLAERNKNVVGYAEFFTNLYFNKENGNLESVEILE